jgi:hypothetical protein
MIDIVNIRTAAKDGKIEFYIKDDIIYCRDTQNGECVRVTFDKIQVTHKNQKSLRDMFQESNGM